jgi:hypothetical protein
MAEIINLINGKSLEIEDSREATARELEDITEKIRDGRIDSIVVCGVLDRETGIIVHLNNANSDIIKLMGVLESSKSMLLKSIIIEDPMK